MFVHKVRIMKFVLWSLYYEVKQRKTHLHKYFLLSSLNQLIDAHVQCREPKMPEGSILKKTTGLCPSRCYYSMFSTDRVAAGSSWWRVPAFPWSTGTPANIIRFITTRDAPDILPFYKLYPVSGRSPDMARRIPYPDTERITGEQAARYIQTEVIRVSDPDLSYFLTLSQFFFF